ncbi:MAG: MlaD family protein [Thiohalocapsa sp.]|jgi:paraquat-inducible protein B
MTEPNTDVPDAEALPEAVADTRRRISLVWLIPLVAALAAGWLVYRAEVERGPLVTIAFASAEGLEAGKTRVRYKDVDIGQVEAIELAEDLSHVLVKARFERDMQPHLTDASRFWVVRPRVSGREISGLGTLIGGAYIGADLSPEGEPAVDFAGLEVPPVVDSGTPGTRFTLVTERLGSIQPGTLVQYRGIEVGQVTGYRLPADDGPIEVEVFVREPHDRRVGPDTRFWLSAGLDVELGVDGIKVSSESLATLLVGGISFGNLGAPEEGPALAPDYRFTLYENLRQAEERRYRIKETWTLEFAGSVRGLQPGAPVEFRGIKIGKVTDISLELDMAALSARIPVTVELEPERLRLSEDGASRLTPAERRRFWDRLVGRGLRAQLKTGSLLTGALYVDLDFYPDDEPRRIAWDSPHPQLPTVPTPFDELRGLLAKVARLPIEEIADDLRTGVAQVNRTLEQTGRLLQRLDGQVAPELTRTLQQSQQALAGFEQILTPSSPLYSETQLLLRELAAAARSIRLMADYLERHPEALLRGKGGDLR